MGHIVSRSGSRVRDAGDPADPDTHMVGGDNFRHVDIPTRSAPIVFAIRISAGVSNDGPENAM